MQGFSGSTDSALAAHQCQILDFTLNLQVQGFRTGSVGSTDSAPGAYGGSVPGRVAGPPLALMTLAQKLGQGQGQAAGSAPVSNGPLFSAGQHRWAGVLQLVLPDATKHVQMASAAGIRWGRWPAARPASFDTCSCLASQSAHTCCVLLACVWPE